MHDVDNYQNAPRSRFYVLTVVLKWRMSYCDLCCRRLMNVISLLSLYVCMI